MDNYIFPLFDPFDILINIVLFAQKGRILSGTQCFFGKKKGKKWNLQCICIFYVFGSFYYLSISLKSREDSMAILRDIRQLLQYSASHGWIFFAYFRFEQYVKYI